MRTGDALCGHKLLYPLRHNILVREGLLKKGDELSMEEKEIEECKSCGSTALYALASRGKEYLVCDECGKVHRTK